jgi:hypothetical protein
MRVAIMQPTYLPWLGYFDLMAESDLFVFLDHVQFEKESWHNRNRIKSPEGWLWLTVPVLKRGRSQQAIAEVEIVRESRWPQKHLNALRHNYAQAPFRETHLPAFEAAYAVRWQRLCDLNIALCLYLAVCLGVRTTFLRSSELGAGGQKTDLVVDICLRLGADEYLSPAGARCYLDAEAFERRGLRLLYQDYHHPSYPQLHGPFISHLSAVDALFNCGPEAAMLIGENRAKGGGAWLRHPSAPTLGAPAAP